MKKDFPLIKNNPEIIFLDSAATMQKPQNVIDSQKYFLENEYTVVGKGNISISKKCEEKIFSVKKNIANFFGTTEKNFCFSAGTTESINFFVHGMKNLLKKGDKILVANFEHNANYLPWLNLKKEIGIEIDFLKPGKDMLFGIESFKEIFEKEGFEKIKLVSIFHASNLTGDFFQNIEEISEFLKEKRIYFFLDCAQTIGHKRINFDKLGISASGFSAHKIGGPTGIGGFYLNDELIDKIKPIILGGGVAKSGSIKELKIISGIEKFEAGTPKVDQIIGFGEAIKYFEENFDKIQENEYFLTKYAFEKFSKFKNIKILGSQDFSKKAGIISFTIQGIDYSELGDFFGKENISLRVGSHCNCLGNDFLCIPGSTRISFAPYNTKEDVDKFFNSLEKFLKEKS